jgi:hypothetical protein
MGGRVVLNKSKSKRKSKNKNKKHPPLSPKSSPKKLTLSWKRIGSRAIKD